MFDMDFIRGLESKKIEAALKKNGQQVEKKVYTGVLLKKVLEALDMDTEGKSQVLVKSLDGYTAALTVEEVMKGENVYLVYEMDDKPLGKMEDGGSGPFQVIMPKDKFCMRWCKFVTGIELQ